ncbi:MAG: hypothetical protein LBW85_10495, partial [Deltaproteobacteria bacterium]|nr:hypothetical protein [Deltaproteobacteria bacterium]
FFRSGKACGKPVLPVRQCLPQACSSGQARLAARLFFRSGNACRKPVLPASFFSIKFFFPPAYLPSNFSSSPLFLPASFSSRRLFFPPVFLPAGFSSSQFFFPQACPAVQASVPVGSTFPQAYSSLSAFPGRRISFPPARLSARQDNLYSKRLSPGLFPAGKRGRRPEPQATGYTPTDGSLR